MLLGSRTATNRPGEEVPDIWWTFFLLTEGPRRPFAGGVEGAAPQRASGAVGRGIACHFTFSGYRLIMNRISTVIAERWKASRKLLD